jgi:L-ascorbate peroxidase
LVFDNAYFKRPFEDRDNKELLWLASDQALMDHPQYLQYFKLYAEDQAAFFNDYAAAHLKMSDLGAKFKYRLHVTQEVLEAPTAAAKQR